MNGTEDFIDNPRWVGDMVMSFKRQCQANNLLNMLSKEVLMANMSQSMEYVTDFALNQLFRRIGGAVSQQQPCEREDIMDVEEQLVIVPMGMEMITNVMEVGEGSSNVAKMRKVRVPRRRGRKKLVK